MRIGRRSWQTIKMIIMNNKQNLSLVRIVGANKYCRLVALLGLFVFMGCNNNGSADIASLDSIIEDTALGCNYEHICADTMPIMESPEQSFSRFGNDIHKVYRNLSDTEIEALNFDGYQMEPFHKVLLDSWKEEAERYRPYYSTVTCPSCKHHLLVVYGSSPREDWESLCGRAGNLAICNHCREVLDFELVVMN